MIRDIANAAKLCREDALIFVHNVFPENELQGSREQPQGNVASMDDVYKVVPIFWRFFNSMPTILLKDVSPSGMFVLRVTGDAYGEIMEPYDEILFALDELEFTPTLAEMHEKAVSSSSREMEAFMEKAIESRTAKVLQVI